ncbi:MAG: hypothetical protein V9G10_01820 [Candidatus Nanopelagicales bacterium]
MPPQRTLAPAATARSTIAATFCCWAWLISGPMSVVAVAVSPRTTESMTSATPATNCVVQAAVDVGPGGGRAVLTGVDQAACHRTVDGGLKVGIGEHHEGGLAAEFEVQSFEPGHRDFSDSVPDFRGAGEGDHAHVRVPDQGLARDRAGARDDVEHAVRKACAGGILGQHERGQWRQFAGLEHDGVSRSDGRQHLPHRHLQRVVPRGDGTDHADRFPADGGGVRAVPLRGRAALQVTRGAGEELGVVNRSGHVELGRQPDRFTGLRGFHSGVLVSALGHDAGEVVQCGAAFGRGCCRPAWEGALCCRDRGIDVCSGRQRDGADNLARGRVDDLERFARARLGAAVDPLAHCSAPPGNRFTTLGGLLHAECVVRTRLGRLI